MTHNGIETSINYVREMRGGGGGDLPIWSKNSYGGVGFNFLSCKKFASFLYLYLFSVMLNFISCFDPRQLSF